MSNTIKKPDHSTASVNDGDQARNDYEERMTQMRRGLSMRQDYYELNLFHKMIIGIMFISVLIFGSLLFFSYLPATKEFVFSLLEKIL